MVLKIGRYDVANGWLAFGSDVAGSISNTAISHVMYQRPVSWITGEVFINVADSLCLLPRLPVVDNSTNYPTEKVNE